MIYADKLLALLGLLFGSTLLLPYQTFHLVPYFTMSEVMSENWWGLVALIVGFFQLYGCFTSYRKIKIKAAIGSSLFWVMVTALMLTGFQGSLVSVGYFILTLVSFLWLHWLWKGRG